ncbi:hypothetical protein [Oryzobacter terrae]|uniref:hypothetical protein n=1 Tax=Oryzobacter terrae TaxID=1620385 RepID=UPI003672E8C1
MSIHADPLFITAEVERRLELAGVHRDGRHHEPAPVGLGVHPFAAVVARLVRSRGPRPTSTRTATAAATRRPRHP